MTLPFSLGANPIPRYALLVMNNRNPPAHHTVEQSRFADIGSAYDGDETWHAGRMGELGL